MGDIFKHLLKILLSVLSALGLVSGVSAATYPYTSYGSSMPSYAGLMAMGVWLFVYFVISIGLYVYTALALMAIAKRTNTPNAWLAWIPVGNVVLISKIAGMHWWPVLLLCSVFLVIIPILGWIVMIGCMITFVVFAYIWQWKMFEKVGRPGWWVLFALIPYLGSVVYLVLLGVAAWGHPGPEQPQAQQQIPKQK